MLPRAVLAGVMLDLRRMGAARARHADHGKEQQTSHPIPDDPSRRFATWTDRSFRHEK